MSEPAAALFLLLLLLWAELHASVSLPDWASRCPLHYADQGLWAAVSALVGCSPWLLCIFFLAFYHTCWSASILLLQLYQVIVGEVCLPLFPRKPAEISSGSPQIAFLGLTSAERTSLTFQQRKLQQSGSLRQNPYK